MTRLLGVDVSFWQNRMDWDKCRDAGARFAFIRAGQGKFSDSLFSQNWQGAKAAGIPRGAYWFYDWRPGIDPGAAFQADRMLELTGGETGEVGLVCDFERPSAAWPALPTRERCLSLIQLFMKRLEDKTGRRPIFYTNLAGINYLRPPSWLTDYPLWVANYGVSRPTFTAWKDWTFWQWTDRLDGLKFGAQSRQIDGNYFNGTEADFAAFCGSTPAQPPEPTPEETVKLIVTSKVNIRSVPTTTDNVATGAREVGEEVNAEQIHIERNNRVWVKDKKGWSAVVHDGVQYMRGL